MQIIREKTDIHNLFRYLFIIFILDFGLIHAQSSSHYAIQKSVLDQEGSVSESTNYRITDTAGQPSPIDACTSTDYHESSGFLGSGVMQTNMDETASDEIPVNFNLFQNYPNPLNPTTTIQYDLPVESQIVLTVYDLSGREVQRLVDGWEDSGSHQVLWNGRNRFGNAVGSGIYFYRIIVKLKDKEKQSFTRVRKMIVMK